MLLENFIVFKKYCFRNDFNWTYYECMCIYVADCSAVCARTKLLLLSMLSQGRDSLERVYNLKVHREIYRDIY